MIQWIDLMHGFHSWNKKTVALYYNETTARTILEVIYQ